MIKTSPRRLPLMVAALLLSLTAVGCIPSRIGVSWAGLTTIGDRQNILVTYTDFMVMVDPATGQEVQLLNEEGKPRIDPDTQQVRRWVVNGISGAQFFGVPLQLDENTLLAADYGGKRLFTINIPNARVEIPAGTPISSQVLADLTTDGTRVFLPSYNRGLSAVDLSTEDLDWDLEQVNSIKDGESGVWAKPLVDNGTLYFGSTNHELYAVNAADGKIKWHVDLNGAVTGTPVIYNGKLYIGNFARKIYEIAPESGEILTSYDTENWVWGAPVIKDGILYAADLDGYVYALNADDGLSVVWKTKATGRGIRPSPLVTDQYVIVAGREGQVDWLNIKTGEIQIKQDVQAEILSDILLIQPSETLNIAEPLVVISTTNRSQLLVAFTLSEGAKSWVYSR